METHRIRSLIYWFHSLLPVNILVFISHNPSLPPLSSSLVQTGGVLLDKHRPPAVNLRRVRDRIHEVAEGSPWRWETIMGAIVLVHNSCDRKLSCSCALVYTDLSLDELETAIHR